MNQELIEQLHDMDPLVVNQIAVDKLVHLLECCTINLVSNITKISRPTLYRWLDTDLALEQMNPVVAGWFILVCETSPKIQLLLSRGPLSHPRLAGRLIKEGNDNG